MTDVYLFLLNSLKLSFWLIRVTTICRSKEKLSGRLKRSQATEPAARLSAISEEYVSLSWQDVVYSWVAEGGLSIMSPQLLMRAFPVV